MMRTRTMGSNACLNIKKPGVKGKWQEARDRKKMRGTSRILADRPTFDIIRMDHKKTRNGSLMNSQSKSKNQLDHFHPDLGFVLHWGDWHAHIHIRFRNGPTEIDRIRLNESCFPCVR